MSSESGERHLSVTLPGWVDEWLEARATTANVPREEYLNHLLEAGFTTAGAVQRDTRDVEEGDAAASFSVLLEEFESVFEHLLERHEADFETDELKQDFGEKITDVRNRVVQLKREVAEKADEDHVHTSLNQDVSEALRLVEENASATKALRDELDSHEDALDQGFDNFETVLEYLTERNDALERRYDHLARSIVSLKQRVDLVLTAEASRKRVDALNREANEHGVRSASCEECGGTVHLGLLNAPRCPHCEEMFDGVEPKTGFFGSHTLTVKDTKASDSSETEGGFQFGRVGEKNDETYRDTILDGIRSPDSPDSS